MAKKTLLPTSFDDWLSLISIFGFLAIFFNFTLDNPILAEATTPVFLILGGAGLLIAGKVLTIKKWTRDGIQPTEFSQLFAIIFGLASIVIGILIYFNVALPVSVEGLVGFLALPPLIFILIDYIKKNTTGRCS